MCKIYNPGENEVRALDHVNLEINRGEFVAIIGHSGSGKSTLMSMLFGMYEPDEGEIYIRGKKEKITSPNYATKLNIGMVHQHFKLVENYTITKNSISCGVKTAVGSSKINISASL